jgi:hypothetical protein
LENLKERGHFVDERYEVLTVVKIQIEIFWYPTTTLHGERVKLKCIKEIGYESVDWIQVAQDMVR